MHSYSLCGLPDSILLRNAMAVHARERTATAEGLAHIAEIDARRLYLSEAYPSMHAFGVGALRLSADEAYRRIRVARMVRRFPAILPALAEGRLHLTSVVLLAPHLSSETADELLAAASGKTKAEIEQYVGNRFSRLDLPGPISSPPTEDTAACQLAPEPVECPVPRPTVAPPLPRRTGVSVTIDDETRDQLLYARSLLGNPPAAGDLAALLRRAVKAWVQGLEKRKFAATTRPGRGLRRASANPRCIPAHVKRTVWARDRGQCTFTADDGHRCLANTRIEYDHIVPVARSGKASAENIRLRCRAHNQFAGEQVFGTEFMRRKREEAQRAKERDVVPWLRQLGFRVDEAKRAAGHCESIPDAPLEERLKAALRILAPHRGGRIVPAPA